jgi:ribosomal protein S8
LDLSTIANKFNIKLDNETLRQSEQKIQDILRAPKYRAYLMTIFDHVKNSPPIKQTKLKNFENEINDNIVKILNNTIPDFDQIANAKLDNYQISLKLATTYNMVFEGYYKKSIEKLITFLDFKKMRTINDNLESCVVYFKAKKLSSSQIGSFFLHSDRKIRNKLVHLNYTIDQDGVLDLTYLKLTSKDLFYRILELLDTSTLISYSIELTQNLIFVDDVFSILREVIHQDPALKQLLEELSNLRSK